MKSRYLLLLAVLFFSVSNSTLAQKIYVVEYESQAYLKIFKVKYESQAGWRNNEKHHLLW